MTTSASNLLTYVEHFSLPPHSPQRVVIWLHGLGDTGHGWLPAVRYLQSSTPTKFILPHAPMRPITLNGGQVMPGWYDIANLDFRDRGDEHSIRASAKQIQALIDAEIAEGVSSTHIVLAGFSQGGAIALHTGLRCPHPLGGILALSTYLPLSDTLSREAHPANAKVAIAMMHGTHDTVIPLIVARTSYEQLQAHEYNTTWKTYSMAHEVSPEELHDIDAWFTTRP